MLSTCPPYKSYFSTVSWQLQMQLSPQAYMHVVDMSQDWAVSEWVSTSINCQILPRTQSNRILFALTFFFIVGDDLVKNKKKNHFLVDSIVGLGSV